MTLDRKIVPKLFVVLLCLLVDRPAHSAMVYNVSHSFAANANSPPSGAANEGVGTIDINGTITTDGTIGILGIGNVTAWNLVFSNPGGTHPDFALTESNSDFSIVAPASLTATATSLDFNIPVPAAFVEFPQISFSDTVGGPDVSWTYLAQNFGTPSVDIDVILDTDGNGPLPFTRHNSHVEPMTSPFMDDLTGGVDTPDPDPNGAIPEPSAVTLSILGLASLGMVGGRRRRR